MSEWYELTEGGFVECQVAPHSYRLTERTEVHWVPLEEYKYGALVLIEPRPTWMQAHVPATVRASRRPLVKRTRTCGTEDRASGGTKQPRPFFHMAIADLPRKKSRNRPLDFVPDHHDVWFRQSTIVVPIECTGQIGQSAWKAALAPDQRDNRRAIVPRSK